MPPKENEIELSELIGLEEQIENLKDALYDARKQLKNAITIPDNATNGDVVKAMFPNELLTSITSTLWWGDNMSFNKDWWNAPYKKGGRINE